MVATNWLIVWLLLIYAAQTFNRHYERRYLTYGLGTECYRFSHSRQKQENRILHGALDKSATEE